MSISLLHRPDSERSGFTAIAAALRAAIRDGSLGAGEQLPPISGLAREYRTTAVTVRRALRMLEEEGLLRVEHGVGTFVCDWSADYELLQLPSFTAEMAERALSVTTEVHECCPAVRHVEAAEALGRSPETELAMLARIRRVEGAPVAFQRSFLAPELRSVVEGFRPADSLYGKIRERTGRMPLSAEEHLTAVLLPEDEARLLHRTPGEAGWLARRVSYDPSGNPLVVDEAYFAGAVVALRMRRRGRETTVEYQLTQISPEGSGNG